MSVKISLKKKLGQFQLNMNFESQSRRIGILGASGCGKSMTLKCIAGIEKPDQGRIEIDQHLLFSSKDRVNPKPGKRNVGYLFQNYALFPNMTVLENIAVGIKAGKKEKKRRAQEYLEKFQLHGLADHYPSQLSGGQQQRVALARIMAYEPQVILLDEPFSAMDIHLKDRLQHELLEMLEGFDGTVIMVSHSRDEIYRFSEELLIMDGGSCVCSGKTKEIFANPKWKEAARLTGCKNIVSVDLMEDHSLHVSSWNQTFRFSPKCLENVQYMGLRAHDFLPVWGEKEDNCIPVSKYRMDELPFERKYYIKTWENQEDEIAWFVQRDMWDVLDEKGMPDFLKLPEDKVLFLQ